MKKLLIKNIKELVQVEYSPKTRVLGHDMKNLPTLKNAWLAIEDDVIVDFGSMDEMPGITDWNDLPNEAKEYILFIEKIIQTPISVISTGPERTQTIDRKNLLSNI